MKKCVLFMALYCFVMNPSFAKIKNGYSIGISDAYTSLQSLTALLQNDSTVSIFQRITIRNRIAGLIEFITYKQFTDRMLEQFKIISPDLYHQIDSLKDCRRRPLDVYVRFVLEKHMPRGVSGTTNLDHDPNDADAYSSEYGIHTVSVRIAVDKKCLTLLAHEFGHVMYQVPNLRDYYQFYNEFYLSNNYRLRSFGHSDKDPSGKSAFQCSKDFNKNYAAFLKLNRIKVQSHVALIQEIRNRIEESQSEPQQSAGF